MGVQLVILGVLLRVRRVRPSSAAVAATAPECPNRQALRTLCNQSELFHRSTAGSHAEMNPKTSHNHIGVIEVGEHTVKFFLE
jgi:hypothetical protein